jgi:hypothetical protein
MVLRGALRAMCCDSWQKRSAAGAALLGDAGDACREDQGATMFTV